MVKLSLIIAARNGDAERVQEHIGQVGRRGRDGQTALMCAASHDHVDCVRLLLPHEARLQNSRGETALQCAVLRGALQAIKLLAPHESGIQTNRGWTALMFAVLKADISSTYLLIEREARRQCNLGWTALMHAVKNENLECAKVLLCEAGLQAKDGTSALTLATLHNSPEIVALLLPYERDLADSDGHTAQWHAENPMTRDGDPIHGDFTAIRRLFETSTGPIVPAPPVPSYPLLVAAIVGDLAMAQEHVACVGRTYDAGQTALMYAAQYGRPDLVQFLAEWELGKQDDFGCPALFYAVKHLRLQCAQRLLCEANLLDEHGMTSFERALSDQNRYGDICMFLRCLFKTKEGSDHILSEVDAGRGAKVYSLLRKIFELTDDTTDLICAANLGSFPLVERLLEQAGMKTTNSMTALMSTIVADDYEYWWTWDYSQCPDEEAIQAARAEREKIITALLPKEKGMQDATGWTALMHALYRGSLGFAMLLTDEASAISTDEAMGKCSGTTALMLAASNGYEDILPSLRQEQGLLDSEGKSALYYALYNGNVTCVPELVREVGVVDSQYRTQLAVIRAHLHSDIAGYVYDEAGPMLEEAYQQVILSGINRVPPHHFSTLLRRMPLDEPHTVESICATLLGEPGALDELDDALFAAEEEHASDSCIVCYARQPDTVLLPCKHLIVCELCADQLDLRCPYCRGDVTEALVLASVEQ
ncbi:Ankyrin repeat protein 2 [Giardia muris]|uniref:Ankyrin repeat protein 2 n=1 Tax=Giardia muris TaxID=5742 RepID=A0A4Z1SP39_GIAMU|nr:Ankyrin repeat protein 2 [Giardia muris]|eukprot:TNJ27400.1 Ankyrin repeat protein 2 [Giardia muris]